MTPTADLILEALRLRSRAEYLDDAEEARLKELEIRIDEHGGLEIFNGFTAPGTAERIRRLIR